MKDFLSSIVLYNFQKFYTYVFIESYNFFFPSPLYCFILLPSTGLFYIHDTNKKCWQGCREKGTVLHCC